MVDLLHSPSMAPISSLWSNAIRPDGYLLLKDRSQGEAVSWADVVLACEYKRKDGNEELDDVSDEHSSIFCILMVLSFCSP
jgi:hypothetical protein